MIKFKVICVSIIALYHSSVFAQDYKCYVELADKTKKVALANIDSGIAKDAANKLLSNGAFAPDGKTKLNVVKVEECVPFRQKFNSYKARLLDKKTPF